jgi:hypothetical protein
MSATALCILYDVTSSRLPWQMFFADTQEGLREAKWHIKNRVEEAACIWTSKAERELRYKVPCKFNFAVGYMCVRRIRLDDKGSELGNAEIVVSADPSNKEFRAYLDTPDKRSHGWAGDQKEKSLNSDTSQVGEVKPPTEISNESEPTRLWCRNCEKRVDDSAGYVTFRCDYYCNSYCCNRVTRSVSLNFTAEDDDRDRLYILHTLSQKRQQN